MQRNPQFIAMLWEQLAAAKENSPFNHQGSRAIAHCTKDITDYRCESACEGRDRAQLAQIECALLNLPQRHAACNEALKRSNV